MANNASNAKVTLADLRCRVEVQRKTLTPDTIGGNTISYTTTSTVWAMIEDWKGKEYYRAERTEGLMYHRVVVRGSTDVRLDDVLVYEGRTMPVKYINSITDGKKKYSEVIVVEGDPVGGIAAA